MTDRDQSSVADTADTADDATMSGSPKGGSTSPAGTTGPGRYGGAEAADDANALEAGTVHSSGLDPMGGPGASAGQDVDGADAMSTHGGPSTITGGAAASAGDEATPSMSDRTQAGGDGGDGEVQ